MKLMGIINLTPDSFYAPSRHNYSMLDRPDIDIIDAGAVSTRPGAPDVSIEEEWVRLEPFLQLWAARFGRDEECGRWIDVPDMWARPNVSKELSIDTTSSTIVRRAFELVGPFIVNDISAGLDDPDMLATVGSLGLPLIAMHKRGNPRTMDSLADPSTDIILQLKEYFNDFSVRARASLITRWVLDPGLGFSKTASQNIEIIERLPELASFNRPILLGIADKRFTAGDTPRYEALAAARGAHILRIH